MAPVPLKIHVSWDDVDKMCDELVAEIGKSPPFDYFLLVSRGGLVPGGILAKRLKQYNILVISVMYYDENDERLPHPNILEAPAEAILRGKRVLIIDDVWDSGHTLALVKKFVERAGGIAEIATLHFKPANSEIEGRPNYTARIVEGNVWIIYPWEPNNTHL